MIDDDDSAAHAATVDDSLRGPRDEASVTADATATTATERAPAAATGLRPGDAIGRYEIVKMLGQGGMGMVYLAYDPTLDRPVALKLLRPELKSAQARLLREGQSVARLAHPNVVRVFDVGADRDDLFIAMEYVDGETLRHWLRAERRSPRGIFEMFAAAGRGLAAAHAIGLVHRDFKPDNVLVGRDGRVVVTDFGLARWGADEPAAPGGAARVLPLTMTLTRTGSLLGTPAYMAPEQLRGEVADARSDQFGFCVACWEALFGARPFALPERATLDDVRRVVEAGIIAPANVTGAMAPTERALRRGLSVAPAERFADMDALLAALVPARVRDAPLALAADERIAHFKILAPLGQGGMGIVYRALDETLGREVALKVLPADVVARADRRERFLREARAAAAVVHPAIATVYEVGAEGDVPFIAMEYVAGPTLRETLARGRWEAAALIRIAIPIADALARAHKAGVVHRDLKPENVMIDGDGAPKILDFGVARMFETPTTGASPPDGVPSVVTSEGVVLGTPAYMSPEQARGLPVDGRSDLFSFGTMLFELLTGAAPFRGASNIDIATAIIRDHPPAPSTLAPLTPAELDRIVGKSLEKDPGDRYQDAAELVVDLRRLLRQTETGGTPVPAPARPRRHRGAAIIAMIGVATVGGAFAAWRATRSSGSTAPTAPAPETFTDRQLTANGAQGVDAGSISPDGGTLAIARDGRLTLQDVATGATRDLAPPATRIIWLSWLDGKRLLAGTRGGPTHFDLVVIPIDGQPSAMLPFHAWGAALSSDGTRYATYDEGGIRVRDADGANTRLLVGTREEAEFGWPVWSPDDKWIAYAVRGKDIRPAIRAVSVDGHSDVLLVDDPGLASPSSLPSYLWIPGGRILYVTHTASTSDLMSLAVDPVTASPLSAPSKLSTYPGRVGLENATGDGGQVLYARSQGVATHVRASLVGATTIEPHPDPHGDWEMLGPSADGTTTFYAAPSSTDRTELLAAEADGRTRVLAAVSGTTTSPQLTPDAKAILFLHVDAGASALTLERVSTDGGSPVVVEKLPYAPSAPVTFTEQLVAQLACSRGPGGACVLGATEGSEQAFYAIDPASGRGRRLGAIAGAPPWSWGVSPDGAHLAVGNRQDVIRIVDIDPWRVTRTIDNPSIVVNDIAWIDDRSFVIVADQLGSALIARVDPDRALTPLWTTTTEFPAKPRLFDRGETLYFRVSWSNRTFWLRSTK